MAVWSDHDVSIDRANIHYYRMGNANKPPVVLLHGFSDSGLAWVRFATDLAPDYDCIMPDAVGHGRSDGPEHGFRTRAVSDVIGLIEALGLDRPALIGHSMGARTAAGVAVEAPERIRCAVLEDPPWRATSPEASPTTPAGVTSGSLAPLRSPGWIAWLQEIKALSPEERIAMARKERPPWSEEEQILLGGQ